MSKLTYEEIKSDIRKAREELYVATKSFEYADTEDLIDIRTLQIEVARKKCDYLIKLAKEQGLASDDIISDNISAVL